LAKLIIKSSITEAALRRFISNAKECDTLSCTTIKGFSVYKNRAKDSASFRYRPSLRGASRNPIILGKANILKISEATAMALEIMEGINDGEEAKDVMRSGRVGPARKLQSKSEDDLSILGNFFEKVYMPIKQRLNEDTAYDSYTIMKREFGHLFKKPMSKLTSKDITNWQDQKEKQGLAYKTIERYYATLIALISMAVKLSHDSSGDHAGLLFDSPFPVRPLRGASKAQREAILRQERDIDTHVRRMLEKEELIKLEKAMERYAQECVDGRERSRKHSNKLHLPSLKDVTFPHWIMPYIYISYYTGLRPGDVSGLEWQDLHNGKLNKVTEKSKHLTKPVVVKLSLSNTKSVFKYSLVEVLTTWRKQQGNPKTGWVFPQIRDDSKPLSEKGYKKSWAKITEYAGLKLHMYSFRHNFISTLIRKGMNMKLVATMSGHKTTEMIELHYAHHFPSDVEEAMGVF